MSKKMSRERRNARWRCNQHDSENAFSSDYFSTWITLLWRRMLWRYIYPRTVKRRSHRYVVTKLKRTRVRSDHNHCSVLDAALLHAIRLLYCLEAARDRSDDSRTCGRHMLASSSKVLVQNIIERRLWRDGGQRRARKAQGVFAEKDNKAVSLFPYFSIRPKLLNLAVRGLVNLPVHYAICYFCW